MTTSPVHSSPVSNASEHTEDDRFLPILKPQTCTDIIWNIVSAILFPIGIVRLALFLKNDVIPGLILPSSRFKREVWDNPDIRDDIKCTLTTPDNVTLDCVKVSRPNAKKWVIFTHGNGCLWQLNLPTLHSAFISDYNVLAVNYRGTGNSNGKATCFEDLFTDIDTAVQHLLDEGVSPDDIILHGHSLGGASAVTVAERRGLKAIVQNTFARIDKIAVSLTKKILIIPINHQTSENQSILQTALFSLKDALFSLVHLAFRVTSLFFLIFVHLIDGNLEKTAEAIIEIGKTLIIDAILTITGLTSFILSPFTSKLNQFNGWLNAQLLSYSAIGEFCSLFVRALNWSPNIANTAIALKDRLFVIYCPSDTIIPENASLHKALENKSEASVLGANGHHGKILLFNDFRIQDFIAGELS